LITFNPFKEKTMHTRQFARLGMALFAVLSTTLIASPFANAQRAGRPAAAPVKAPATLKVGSRTLQRTAFQINPDFISASCNTPGCTAVKNLFTRTLQCDGAAGKTCTFYLHIDAQLGVSNFDNGMFRFRVDNLPATPGPTDENGYVTWNIDDPNSAGTDLELHSFSVVAFVTNTSLNQQHNVQIDIHCEDINSDGCDTNAQFATLQGVVYTP
jgi:hypothetical protein